MKKTYFSFISSTLFIFFIVLTSSCRRDCTEFRTYIKYIPLEKSLKEVRESFKVESPRNLENPRKIYVYEDYLLIVDEFKGFQVVDNSNTSSPVALKFIRLDACTDVSVQNGIIYANQGPDVVSLSFNNAADISITGRLEKAMNTELIQGDNFIYDYERIKVTEEVACSQTGGFARDGREFAAASQSLGNSGTSSGGSSGTGGSMARMSFVQGLLYVVDNSTLTTIKVTNGFQEMYKGFIGSGVETIFGTKDYLYLGTTTGMLIYNRNNGNQPSYVSRISHARGCDPVVVQGNYAFVTVRGNGNCGQANDELMVIDISTITAPKLHSTHAMSSPYGLGVEGEIIMICDGPAGLRIFDKTDLSKITKNEIATISGIDAYDIIPMDNWFILSTSQGVFQYDNSNPKKPKLLSKIY
jgi:hypothetical protein